MVPHQRMMSWRELPASVPAVQEAAVPGECIAMRNFRRRATRFTVWELPTVLWIQQRGLACSISDHLFLQLTKAGLSTHLGGGGLQDVIAPSRPWTGAKKELSWQRLLGTEMPN